jgi:hypothetical protein
LPQSAALGKEIAMKSPNLGYVKNKEIIGVRKLTTEEFNTFQNAYDEINKYIQSGELFTVALLNHDDFFNALNKYLDVFQEIQDVGKQNLDRAVLDLNRKILNFLCSVRTFLDHNETDINRSYGKGELEYFKKICADHYDGGFAYRFLYKLRNYAQHCGMPVGNLLINSEKDEKSKTGKRVTISLVFDRDKLLSRFDGWKTLKTELSEKPDYFDIAPLIEEMTLRLGDIYLSLVEKLFPNIKVEAELMENYVNEINDNQSRVVIFDYTEKSDTNAQLTFKEIPIQQATWVLEDLKKLNA